MRLTGAMAPSSFRQVTLQMEEDFHQRRIHIGADGSVLCSLGGRMRVLEKVFVVHPGDAWGIITPIMEYGVWRDLFGIHVTYKVKAIGLFGAVYALGHHHHKTRRGDSSGATLATQVSNVAQRVA